jgi:hypothetical protein
LTLDDSGLRDRLIDIRQTLGKGIITFVGIKEKLFKVIIDSTAMISLIFTKQASIYWAHKTDS